MFREKVVLDGNIFILEDITRSIPDSYPYHLHPEYEIMLIEGATGKWFIGDRVEPFYGSEVVLLGPNLPHKWQFDNLQTNCKIVVLKWKDIADNELISTSSGIRLKQLWKNAKNGVRFKSPVEIEQIKSFINILRGRSGLNQMIAFLSLFEAIVNFEHEVICQSYSVDPYSSEEITRLDRILNYINSHLGGEIHLDTISSHFHLTKSGFCTLFKKRTGKTFSSYLNELRIAQASRLLVETDKPVLDIAFEVGFRNMSYFNRQFLMQKQTSPRNFRKEFWRE